MKTNEGKRKKIPSLITPNIYHCKIDRELRQAVN